MESRCTWILPSDDASGDGAAEILVRELGLLSPVARLLSRRGYRDPDAVRKLLDPRAEHLLDPFLMAGMQAAADRLVRALGDGDRIVVNGDYDADGVTGTALLVSELRGFGAQADFFIPDRERDGYGITPRLVQRAGEVGIRVLISVDCGSSDHATIETARGLGIDVIVVDHHEIPEVPEHACAVLNPKRADCRYPFKGLSAVGVGYKLLQAVGERLSPRRAPADGLDLVALGTLADVQPVVGENRTLVSLGLERLTHAPRPGVRALRDSSGLGSESVRSRQVGFRLVPRLNAVGRVARGKLAVDLLLATDGPSAEALASEIETQNRWRQKLEQGVTSEATRRAEALVGLRDAAAIVLASPSWHFGVVGITAARLVDRFGMPAAVIGIQNGKGRGSVRTTDGMDVKAALDTVSDLLVKYGGHREAAGFSIEPRRIAEFAERFEATVRAQRGEVRGPALEIDAVLVPGDAELALVEALEQLEPFGTGHPEPLFLFRGLRAGPRTRLVGEGHLKLELLSGGGRSLDAIAFGWGERARPAETVGRELDVVGYLRRQDPRWGGGVQVIVTDLCSSAAAPGGTGTERT